MADSDFVNSLVADHLGFDPDPSTWGPIIAQASKQYNVPPEVIKAHLAVENSGGSDQRTSSAGAEGIGQFMPDTAKAMGVDNVYDPRQAIPGMAKYLAEGHAKTGSWAGAAQYYQSGSADPAKWGPTQQQYLGQIANAVGAQGADPQALLAPSNSKIVITHDGKGLPVGARIDTPSMPAPQGAELAVPQPSLQLSPAPGVASPGPTAAPAAAPESDFVAQLLAQHAAATAPTAPVQTQAVPDQAVAAVPPPAAAPALNLPTPQQLAPPPAPSAVPPNPNAQGQWDLPANLANAMLLGHGQPLIAGANSLSLGVGNMLAGQPLSTAFSGDASYAGQQKALDAARVAWQQANPGMNGLTQFGGALASTLGAGKLLGAGARLGGEALTAVAPYASPVVNGVTRLLGGTVGEGVGGLTGKALRGASKVVAGAATGAGDAALQQGLSQDPMGDNVAAGAKIGGGLSAVGLPAGAVIGRLVNPAVTKAMAALAETPSSRALGLRPAQVGQGGLLKNADAFVSRHSDDQQMVKFAEELKTHIGVPPGEELTPESLKKARVALGDHLDVLGGQTGVDGQLPDASGATLLDHLKGIGSDINQHLALDPRTYAPIARYFNSFPLVNGSAVGLVGPAYLKLTQKGSPLASFAKDPNSNVAQFAIRIKDALTDAMQRTAVASGNPGVAEDVLATRRAYKNNITVEPLVDKSVSGIVNPQGLLPLVNRSYTNLANAGEFGNLAQVGQVLARPSAQGDTANPRNLINVMKDVQHSRHLFHSLMAGAGLGAAAHEAGVPWALPIAGGSLALAGLHHGLSKMLTDPATTNRLIQQTLHGARPYMPANPLIPLATQIPGFGPVANGTP